MKKILCLFMVTLILLSGCSVKKTKELTDAEKFAVEYSITDKNPFKYVTIDEVLNILKDGSGIIFFGNSDCEFCLANVGLLTEVLNSLKIKQVYYYNPTELIKNNTKKYKKLLKELDGFLEKDENDNEYLFLPDTYFVENGEIVAHNNDFAAMNMENKELTIKEKKSIKDKLIKLTRDYIEKKECTDC